jgi:N-terminal region of glycosyl transferase group 7
MKVVFVVPYRNRPQHKFFFVKHMAFLLDDFNEDYEILFVHQCDSRNFNRGAMKNIGFLICKEKYPDTYKDITFIFHDIDTLPFHKLFAYATVDNSIKHYYGFETALGGIFAIKGKDFEKTKGFPNYWGWGMEDTCFQNRCLANNLKIDRSNFYEIGNPNILQFFDGVNRLVSTRDYQRMKTDNGLDGFHTIHRLKYTLNEQNESSNLEDNKYIFPFPQVKMVNVTSFITLNRVEREEYYNYDLRDPTNKILKPVVSPNTQNVVTVETSWTNIPAHERTEILLKRQNQQIQQQLFLQNQQQMMQQPVKQHPAKQRHPLYRKRRLLY